MLGSIDPKERKVTVVGGGIAGLLIAYELDRQGFEVNLYEAEDRLGGLIRTEMTPWGISEWAAHSLLVTPAVRDLCEELGVELIPINPESKARYVLRGGKLRRFPLSPWEAIAAFFRAYFVLSNRKKLPEQLTLREWAERFLGKPALKYLLTPMLRGIYGATPDELVVGAAFPKLAVPPGHSLLSFLLAKWIRRWKFHNKIPRSAGQRSQMMTARRGMEDLIRGLEARLRERLANRIHLGQKIAKLPKEGNVVLAVPAKAAAHLLKLEDPELSQVLEEILYTPLLVVKAFVRRDQLKRVPRGVGVLMPEGEQTSCLGILFNSSSFSERVTDPSTVSLSLFFGGTQSPEKVDLPDSAVERMVVDELKQRFGFDGALLGSVIHRQRSAIPQYNQKLLEAWGIAQKGWCSKPCHVLFGNFTGAVSIRGMIETVREGKLGSLGVRESR